MICVDCLNCKLDKKDNQKANCSKNKWYMRNPYKIRSLIIKNPTIKNPDDNGNCDFYTPMSENKKERNNYTLDLKARYGRKKC